MIVIYAVLYILIYLLERYLKKDIEELQITRRELLVVYFVMVMVYCISNVSYADVKSIFSAGTDVYKRQRLRSAVSRVRISLGVLPMADVLE